MRLQFVLVCSLLLCAMHATAEEAIKEFDNLEFASLIVLDPQGRVLRERNASRLFVPASTVKVLTALIALEYWGKDHRFTTEFYWEEMTNILWVRGAGDPYLISEELELIAAQIAALPNAQYAGIGVDVSYFTEEINFDGQGNSNNPYDASASALAANFNTINVRVNDQGIRSAEIQTPLTPLAKKLATNLPQGTQRINLGRIEYGPQYFAELLRAKLNIAGVIVDNEIIHGRIPMNAKPLLVYQNSKTLENVVASMLKYSNNFIANQLYLMLGAEEMSVPADPRKSRDVFQTFISERFEWAQYELLDGAGLSRQNRLSARQLIDVLQDFQQYRYLMPAQNEKIRAKTGTLRNVSTYVGYLQRHGEWSLFALLINEPVRYDFRERLAETLLN